MPKKSKKENLSEKITTFWKNKIFFSFLFLFFEIGKILPNFFPIFLQLEKIKIKIFLLFLFNHEKIVQESFDFPEDSLEKKLLNGGM